MSHAALVNAGLWYITLVQPVLLVLFIRAVVRAPAGPADGAARPGLGPLAPEAAAPPPGAAGVPGTAGVPGPAGVPAQVAWPPASAAGASGDGGYVGRHATRGGPPWGPAPRPPGAAW